MNLDKKDDNQLMTLFHNARNHADRVRANKIKQEIYAIWEARNKQLCSDSKISIVFSDGVLKAFRYGVGDSGISNETERRQILDHVLEAPIPPVKDKSYTLEWGKPRSLKRKEKLIRTLRGLIAAKERMTSYHRSSFNRAIHQWKDDLRYLTANLA